MKKRKSGKRKKDSTTNKGRQLPWKTPFQGVEREEFTTGGAVSQPQKVRRARLKSGSPRKEGATCLARVSKTTGEKVGAS